MVAISWLSLLLVNKRANLNISIWKPHANSIRSKKWTLDDVWVCITPVGIVTVMMIHLKLASILKIANLDGHKRHWIVSNYDISACLPFGILCLFTSSPLIYLIIHLEMDKAHSHGFASWQHQRQSAARYPSINIGRMISMLIPGLALHSSVCVRLRLNSSGRVVENKSPSASCMFTANIAYPT